MNKPILVIYLILFVFCFTSVLSAANGIDVGIKKINAQFYILENQIQKIKLADTALQIIKLSKEVTGISEELSLKMYELEKKYPELFYSRKPQRKIAAIMEKFSKLIPEMKVIIVKLKSFQEYMEVRIAIKSLNKLFE
ncbi:hypothetical protein KAJ27_25580 [bacterium]|nr:hypothetical protein [bacterium]